MIQLCESNRKDYLIKDSLKKWEDKESGSAGCEMTLNFDGAKILYRVFRKKNSNLLFIRIAPDSSSVEPIAGIEFSTYACINLEIAYAPKEIAGRAVCIPADLNILSRLRG